MNDNEAPRPKPAPPKPKAPEAPPAQSAEKIKKSMEYGKPQDKPKFVRKPHLTDRPFVQNEGLKALQKELAQKQKPRRGQRRPNKESK